MRATISLIAILALSGCKQQARQLRDQPADRALLTAAPESPISPGGATPKIEIKNPYEGNAYAINEGQQLFDQMNCTGCHFHGGGGIGPPLMNKQFIYGSEPENIFDTIAKGRPRGMPAWGGRLQASQIWKLVAYVRSLSGSEPSFSTPARDDHLEKKTNAQLK